MMSDLESDTKKWKALWAIQAPGKMLITLWRFAHDCLPTGVQLQRRHIPASPECIHCFVEERVDHALLFCPFARQVWDEVKESFDIHLNRNDFRSPKMWLFDFLGRCSRQEGTVLAVTFWHLWDARNKLREEGGSVHPTSIATKIKVYVDLIISQLVSSDSDHRCGTSRVVSWSPPPEGFLMVNVDAAIFESSSCMGAGVVIRDSAGQFVGAYGECT
jgi:hypothetical protein